MKIFLATWLQETSQEIVLNQTMANKRLLSYHFILTQTKNTLENYHANFKKAVDGITEANQTIDPDKKHCG